MSATSEKLGAIEATLEIFVQEFRREREVNADHREAIRLTMTAQSQAVATLSGNYDKIAPQIADIRSDVAAVSLTVEDFKANRSEAVGAAKLAKFAWGAAVGLAGLVGAYVGKKF